MEEEADAVREREVLRQHISREQQRILQAKKCIRGEQILLADQNRKRKRSSNADLGNDFKRRLQEREGFHRLHFVVCDMEQYFAKHPELFMKDAQKIDEACTHLNQEYVAAWTRHVASRAGWEPGWQDFCSFSRNRVIPPESAKEAISKLLRTRQVPFQAVKEYAEDFEVLESYLAPKSVLERKEMLRESLQKKLRLESEKSRWSSMEPDSFWKFVDHLSKIEKFLEDEDEDNQVNEN